MQQFKNLFYIYAYYNENQEVKNNSDDELFLTFISLGLIQYKRVHLSSEEVIFLFQACHTLYLYNTRIFSNLFISTYLRADCWKIDNLDKLFNKYFCFRLAQKKKQNLKTIKTCSVSSTCIFLMSFIYYDRGQFSQVSLCVVNTLTRNREKSFSLLTAM